VADPTSAWGRAGIGGGDEIISVSGRAIEAQGDLTAALAAAKVGDVVRVVYVREGERRTADVTLTGYETVRVTIADLPRITERQRMVRRSWLRGPRAPD
jgi:predicted metalloprotease with PDZ domain